MTTVAIIPARYASTRLPGKPLSDIHGKPMVQHVYERARQARSLDRVLVATEDERIVAAVRAFGGEVVLTSPAHATGTDRLAEVARSLDAEVVVNVQGDEPLVDPRAIDAVARAFDDPSVHMSTVAVPLRSVDEMLSPMVVKVVVDARRDALYFSRAPVPFVRRGTSADVVASAAEAVGRGLALKHLGLYGYRRETLLQLAGWPPAPLEEAEGLEQLRALHNGVRIRVETVELLAGPAVDTAEDLERVRALLDRSGPVGA